MTCAVKYDITVLNNEYTPSRSFLGVPEFRGPRNVYVFKVSRCSQ